MQLAYEECIATKRRAMKLAFTPILAAIASSCIVTWAPVAAGRLDAFYEHGLQPWDRAAGALIAAEAGARVVLPGPEVNGAGLTVAAAPGVADALLAALERFDGLAPITD